MSLPRRRNVIPLLVALAAVALTLVGAKRLMDPEPVSQGGGGNPPANGRGPVVLGTVYASDPLAYYGLAETMQAGKILHVVKENAEVQIGTVLIEYDKTLAALDLATAEQGVKVAEVKVLQAQLQEALYPFDVALQKIAVHGAKEDYASAVDALTRGKEKMERYLSGTNPRTGELFTKDQKEQERRENIDLMKGEAGVRILATKAEAEQKKLEKVEALKPSLLTQDAEAELAVRKAVVARAKYAVDSCVVRAAGPGVVGQVLAGPGAMVYPQSPPPVMVVPTGPRFVRAEVEPEFAHKLAGSEGRAVVVYDNNNFSLTYAGTVKRIGQVFLPKRGQGLEAFAANNTKILEVVIEIADSAPAGKPPLLVNQPVRVSFP